MAPEGIINANNNGTRTPTKKSGEISNIPASTKRSKSVKLEINTVNRTFTQFFLDIFKSSITIAASTKSIITNNQSSPTFHPSNKSMNTARRTMLIISQNTQLFSQDLIFSMIYKLKNKTFYILNSDNIKTFNTKIYTKKST